MRGKFLSCGSWEILMNLMEFCWFSEDLGGSLELRGSQNSRIGVLWKYSGILWNSLGDLGILQAGRDRAQTWHGIFRNFCTEGDPNIPGTIPVGIPRNPFLPLEIPPAWAGTNFEVIFWGEIDGFASWIRKTRELGGRKTSCVFLGFIPCRGEYSRAPRGFPGIICYLYHKKKTLCMHKSLENIPEVFCCVGTSLSGLFPSPCPKRQIQLLTKFKKKK